MDLKQLLALAALIGFFLAIAVVLVVIHHSESDDCRKAKLEQLICNRYGEFDIAACAFWLGVGTMVWGLVYCLLKGKVPDGIGALYGTFATALVGPLVIKVIFKGKPPVLPGSDP